jgi:hypothetical protein
MECDSLHASDSFGLGNAMRGADQRSEDIFSCVRLEPCVSADDPLRAIRNLCVAALKQLSRDFSRVYACSAQRPVSWPAHVRVVLRARRGLQSRSYSEDAGGKGKGVKLETNPQQKPRMQGGIYVLSII